ncbi:MAG: phosphoglycolate phosphatase [Thermoleophilaceae bacterium]|nr:phosphoglycolate phosphatase [Thermoleophilaceae bacterium]
MPETLRNPPPIAVLFDIDGTLISTGGAGAKSWKWAFQQLHGIPADIGEYTDAGMTDPDVARGTFKKAVGHDPSPQEMAAVIGAYLSILPDNVQESEGYKVLDGVYELLPELVKRGVLLGITTGAVEAAAHVKLGRAKLNKYFAFGGYGSDSGDRIELTRRAIERGGAILGHPLDAADVLVVGDTPRDVMAALGAGAVPVGVASHHHTEEQLREAGAEYVIGTLVEGLPGL